MGWNLTWVRDQSVIFDRIWELEEIDKCCLNDYLRQKGYINCIFCQLTKITILDEKEEKDNDKERENWESEWKMAEFKEFGTVESTKVKSKIDFKKRQKVGKKIL